MRRMLIALGVACAIALPARAQGQAQPGDRPPAQPTQDFAITYRITPDAGGDPVRVRINHSAALSRQRIEAFQPDGSSAGIILLDIAAQRVTLLDPAERTAAVLPEGLTDLAADFLALFDIQPFTPRRMGQDQVLGRPCTLWRLSEDGAEVGNACVTEGGILLRATEITNAGEQGRVEATELAMGTQPPALFAIPDGYISIQVTPAPR